MVLGNSIFYLLERGYSLFASRQICKSHGVNLEAIASSVVTPGASAIVCLVSVMTLLRIRDASY